MSIEEAMKELISSADFKNIAKKKDAEGGKYRVLLSRYKAGTLKTGAMVELLEKHGYVINITKGS